MNAPVITAGIEPLLFYLVIVVVWTIAKKFSEKARKQGGPAAPPEGPLPPKDVNDGLREFIETMTGQKLPRVEPPPAPPPVVTRRKPIVREVTPQPQDVPQIQRRQEPRLRPVPPTPTPALAPKHYAKIHTPTTPDIKASEISDVIGKEAPSTLGALEALTRMQSMRMAMPSFKLPLMRDSSRNRFRVDLKDHQRLRQAVVARIILGPPPAMGADPDDRHLGL